MIRIQRQLMIAMGMQPLNKVVVQELVVLAALVVSVVSMEI